MIEKKFIIQKVDKCLKLQIDYPEQAKEILLKIDSDRNTKISCFSDSSPNVPQGAVHVIKQDYVGEIWFPVVDLVITPSLYAEARFTDEDHVGTITFNAWLWPEKISALKQIRIEAQKLLEWENGLYVEDKQKELEGFSLYMRLPIPLTVSRRFQTEIKLLSEDWSGTISAFYKLDGEAGWGSFIGQQRIEMHQEPPRISGQAGFSREYLINALAGNLEYILSSRIQSQNNPMNGGFYLFYDLDAKTYRLPTWLWGWAPAIRALLKGSHVPEISKRFGASELVRAASDGGVASLQGQVYQEDPELNGLGTARWDPNLNMEAGYRQRVCGASDSGFLCGWAWCALYSETGDDMYLEAAFIYAKSAEYLVDKYGIPPQDYIPEEGRWSPHTLDESGFGVKAFDELYHLTGDETYKRLGKRYIDHHLEKFERLDGLWERSYFREEDSTEPSIFMTRGLGWAMEGLLSAYHLTDEQTYLDRACVMADYLVEQQGTDGAWNFMLKESAGAVGKDDKGTPLWSLLLYRLYRFSHQNVYLSSARKALTWCMEQQLAVGETECIGGIAGANPQSAVVYRPWFTLSCLYTSGFFALALLEELELQEMEKEHG